MPFELHRTDAPPSSRFEGIASVMTRPHWRVVASPGPLLPWFTAGRDA